MLDAAGCGQAVVSGRPVNHRERIRAFGQYYLELGRATNNVEVGGLPPDNELPVGLSSQCLGKDTAVWADTGFIGAQVVIVWKQGIEERTALIRVYRHALLPVEQLVSGRGCQLQVAVRPGKRH